MQSILNLAPKPKFITFDCYGTIVQWHRALQSAVRSVLAARGRRDVDEANAVTEALRTLSMERQQQPPYRDYKTILQSGLAEVMAERQLWPRPDDGETLLSCLRAIPPHPDVPPH